MKQLQVVDDDQPMLRACIVGLRRKVARVRSPSKRARTDLRQRRRAAVDANFCLRDPLGGSTELVPVRRLQQARAQAVESTRASLASKRSVSASPDISHENTSAGVPCSIAAYSAQFMAKDVLPIEGRPPTMIRSPGCRPAVIVEFGVSRRDSGDGLLVVIARL